MISFAGSNALAGHPTVSRYKALQLANQAIRRFPEGT